MLHTLIIHGYSDCSESFKDLKAFLVGNGVGEVKTILYVDYQSREDKLTLNDVADGLNEKLLEKKLIRPDGTSEHTFNVIVHSTGGLVIRHWIACYYGDKGRIDICPVKKIIMLAPANFGSPLAHRGKSFLGSLVKGRWKVGDFLEVGQRILDSLELASPFQWELAHRDLLLPTPWFNRRQIQLTIIVGIEDYGGIRGLVNAPGTDGTVVIAGTCLDTAKIYLDFSKPEDSGKEFRPFSWSEYHPPSDFAFTVLPGFDHGSIVSDIDAEEENLVSGLIMKALQQNEDSFEAFVRELDELRLQTYADSGTLVYQQFIVRAIDDLGAAVTDFNLEFNLLKCERIGDHLVLKDRRRFSGKEEELSARLQAIMSEGFHTNGKDPSFRRLLVNLTELYSLLEEAKTTLKSEVAITVRIHVPNVEKGIRYRTDRMQNVLLHASNQKKDLSFIFPNTTTLIEMRVDRFNDYVKVGP
jgi:hypothetical protein